MKKATLLTAILVVLLSIPASSQEPNDIRKDEIRIRKQNVVADIERQIKDVPFAAVRVYARYRLASWLWKDGDDETGRAEEIAVAAIDDHYKNKGEMPYQFLTDARLFALLDKHAKETAVKLRAKYKVSVGEDAKRIPAMLGEPNGEKLAADTAVALLARRNEESPDLVYLLMNLEERESPELLRVLASILTADESGLTRFPTNMVEIFTGFYLQPNVPDDLRKRFIRLVLGRTRNVAALSEFDQMAYYRTMQRIFPEISARYPELVGEVGTIHAFLNARVSSAIREGNERHERIQNSADKLAATVSEAERADDDGSKYVLYRSAARLALQAKKFTYAVDLMEKASEIDAKGDATQKEKDFRKQMHEEFYRSVVRRSLEADELAAATYASRRLTGLPKAESLSDISRHLAEKGDIDSARTSHDEAIKMMSALDSGTNVIAAIIRMIPTASKIDSSRVAEVNQLAAKKINALPTLNVEDKPDTKAYREHVTDLMIVNYNLQPALSELVRSDRAAAEDLAGRIERKEIKVIANYVMSTSSVDIPTESPSLPDAMSALR